MAKKAIAPKEPVVASKQSGPMRRAKKIDNIRHIAQGMDTPPKVMTCGIVSDADGNFIAHVHASPVDERHFIKLRGKAEDGGCRMCAEGVPLWAPQLYRVIDGSIRFIDKEDPDRYSVQLHPE